MTFSVRSSSKHGRIEEAIKNEILCLECCGSVVDPSGGENGNSTHIKGMPFASLEICVGSCLNLAGIYRIRGDMKAAREWVTDARKIEGALCGGGIEVFKLRYADVLQVHGLVGDAFFA